MLLTPEDTSDHPGVPREKRLDIQADEEGSPAESGIPSGFKRYFFPRQESKLAALGIMLRVVIFLGTRVGAER
jgi:hypothetical protein